jgi:hypothetical protein
LNKYLSFVVRRICTPEINAAYENLRSKSLVFTVNFDLQSTVQECEATKASFMFYGWKQKKSPGKASHRDSFRLRNQGLGEKTLLDTQVLLFLR